MDNKICNEVPITMNTRENKTDPLENTNYIRTQSGAVIAVSVKSPENKREKKTPAKNVAKDDDKER